MYQPLYITLSDPAKLESIKTGFYETLITMDLPRSQKGLISETLRPMKVRYNQLEARSSEE